MTDQPPGNPGDVWVTGQRRQANGLFPRPAGAGGSGGTGSDGETHQQEVGDEDPTPGTYVDPCAEPATALPWNADAAAAVGAAAVSATITSLNDGSTLSNREFGVNLIKGTGGQVQPQPNISVGSPATSGQIPNVFIDMTGVTPENWMGDLHNHPSGDGRLSSGEWADFINRVSSISASNPERRSELAHVYAYVMVPDSATARGYRIYVYNRDSPPDALGPEVNPDAQPCP